VHVHTELDKMRIILHGVSHIYCIKNSYLGMGVQYLYPLGGSYIPFSAVCIPQPRQRRDSENSREKRVQAGPEPTGTDSLLVDAVVQP